MTDLKEIRLGPYSWIKFRTMHAHGYGDWRFRKIHHSERESEELLMSVLEELNDELNTYGEGWRGVEGEWANPPRSTFVNQLARAKQRLKDALREYEEACAEMETAPPPKWIVRLNPALGRSYIQATGAYNVYYRHSAKVFETRIQAAAVAAQYPNALVEEY